MNCGGYAEWTLVAYVRLSSGKEVRNIPEGANRAHRWQEKEGLIKRLKKIRSLALSSMYMGTLAGKRRETERERKVMLRHGVLLE